MIRVVLADDQDLVRAGVRALLGHDADIEVVAEAPDGVRAVAAVRRYRPDVVLMDLRMPRLDGIGATRRLQEDPDTRDTRVVILSTFDEEHEVLQAIRAGAVGYLMKDAPGVDLREAVRKAARGEKLLAPKVIERLFGYVAAGPEPPVRDPRLALLTDRELEVLVRVGHGDSNEEIARVLYLSPASSRTYVSRIMGKLGARDRTELAVIAHRSGLVG